MIKFKQFYEAKTPEEKALQFAFKNIADEISKLKAEATDIYETFAVICAIASSANPTIDEITKLSKLPQIAGKGQYWIDNAIKAAGNDSVEQEALRLVVSFVGAGTRKIPGINWGSGINFISRDIKSYYSKMPNEYTISGSKSNTADVVFIENGTAKELLSLLDKPDTDLSFDEKTGKITLLNKGKEIIFIQVSLKKEEGGARIGKLITFLTQRLGIQSGQPTKMIKRRHGEQQYESFRFYTDLDIVLQLDEGLIGILTKSLASVGMIAVTAIKKGLNAVRKLANKLLNPIKNKTIKIAKRGNSTGHKLLETLNNINKEMHLKESVLNEKGGALVISKTSKKHYTALLNIIKANDPNDLLNELITRKNKINDNIHLINPDKDEDPVLFNIGKKAKVPTGKILDRIKKILKYPDGHEISREEAMVPLKISANVASYLTLNDILDDISPSNLKDMSDAERTMLHFNAAITAEAKFGDTKLPLWISFGGKKPHATYLGTKDNFTDDIISDIIEKEKGVDSPYFVLIVRRSKGVGLGAIMKDYNIIVLKLLVGFADEHTPEYLVIEFQTMSGSSFSYKVDASKIEKGLKR